MSQKVNANLFRSSLKNSEWNYKYSKKNKEETSIFLYKNIEIKKYFTNLFKFYGFIITSFKFEFSRSYVIIYISFLKSPYYNKQLKDLSTKSKITKITKKFLITVLNKYYTTKIKLKLKDLNNSFENKIKKSKIIRSEYLQLLKKLKRFKNYPNFIDITKTIFIVITNRNSSKLFGTIISFLILITSKKKKHYAILTFIKNLLVIVLNSKISLISGIKIKISGRINGAPRAKSKLINIGCLPLQSLTSYINYNESKTYTQYGTFGIKIWICEK